MKKIFTILGISVMTSLAAQTTVLTENFNTNGVLSTLGWTTHSGTAGQMMVSGNAAQLVAGNGEDVNKEFSTVYALPNGMTSKVVLTASINVLNSTGLSTNGDYFMSLGGTAGTTVTILPARVYVKAGTNGYLLGVLNTSGGTVTPTYATNEVAYGTASNITLTYTVTKDASGATTMQVAELSYAGTGLLTNSTGTGNASANIASVALRQAGSATSGTGNISIDDIVVTTFTPATLSVSDFNKTKSSFVKNTFIKNDEISFGSEVRDVKVYTLSGQLVKTSSVKANETLNVAELAKGNYIVTGTVNNQPVSQKILKD